MAIQYDQIPATTLVPFAYVEIASAGAGAAGGGFRSVLIGQKIAAGTAAAEDPIIVGDAADARAKFGAGSMLAIMCEAFRRQNPVGRLWAVALNDAASAVQQVQTVTVGAAATGAGTISLYIGGRRIAVPISGALAQNAVAMAIHTAVVAAGGGASGVLPVVATVATNVVTLTARNGGAASDIDIRHSYQPDEALPPGVTLTIAETTAGATDPDITDALDTIEDQTFNVIGHPYNAATSMTALETELTGRWGPTRQRIGLAFTALRGTAAAATTYGNARNSRYSSVMGISTSPSAVPQWSGAIAGAVALSAAADPAQPIQYIELDGILPAPTADRFSHATRETLLADGIATHRVNQGGAVELERVITTYQTAAGGAPDTAFRDTETLFNVSSQAAAVRNRLQTKFPRFKLAPNGTRFGAGQRVVTPSIARAELVALYREFEGQGLVRDATEFKRDLVVEINAQDPDRLDIKMTSNLIGQLRVTATRFEFSRAA